MVEKLQQNSVDKIIIYAATKETVLLIWKQLSVYGPVSVHHSSLTSSTRTQAEDKFKKGDTKVMIATVGFGMVKANSYSIFTFLKFLRELMCHTYALSFTTVCHTVFQS